MPQVMREDTTMTGNRSLKEDPSSVQVYLTIMQGVILRMAENSRSCKVWCITLVTATLVLVAPTGQAQDALITLVSLVNHNCRFGVGQYAADFHAASLASASGNGNQPRAVSTMLRAVLDFRV